MNHLLDRPVWGALTGRQAHLAHEREGAVRLDTGYGPFAAAPEHDPGALRALFEGPEDTLWVVEPQGFAPPPGLHVRRSGALVQMVAEGPPPPLPDDLAMDLLGEADAPAMARLAEANQPGPWGPTTHRYGAYYGIRQGGALVAMAGERMRPAPGFSEVSGVCVDPAFRGRGWAAGLIARVMAGFAARGEASFLHSWADNHGAIALYERLGYRVRAQLVAAVLAQD